MSMGSDQRCRVNMRDCLRARALLGCRWMFDTSNNIVVFSGEVRENIVTVCGLR